MQVQNDVLMSDHLWYQIGGRVKHFITASSQQDVLEAIDFIAKNNVEKVFVCGLGANLIFSDEYFDGVVLQITSGENKLFDKVSLSREVDLKEIKKEGAVVTVFAGEVLDNLVVYSLSQSLTGLEWAGGLPGTVGAGVRGNVGAFGGEIKDTFLEASVLVRSGATYEIKTMSKEELNFSYRTSAVKLDSSLIVLSSTFQLYPAVGEKLVQAKQTYMGNIMYRKTRHPLDKPNCGSVFKNISKKEEVEKVLSVWPDVRESVEGKWHGKVSMGYIINRLGLSEKRSGNAQISAKHSNFIVNLGGAKAADVIELIQTIQDKTEEALSFRPEVEVEIVA